MKEAFKWRKLNLKKNANHTRQVALAYRRRNKEKIRIWQRLYREKNRELIRIRNRIYRKRYKQRHRQKIQAYQRIYRAKKRNQKIKPSKNKTRPKIETKASVSAEESCPWFTCPFDTDLQQIQRLDLIISRL